MWVTYGALMRAKAAFLTNVATTAILIAAATVLKAWKECQELSRTVVSEQLAEPL
jgi:hypothetical protein